MELITKENIGLILGIIGAIPVFKGGFIYLTSWNKRRKMAAIEKEILLITKLSESDRELYLFLFRSVFAVTAFLAISIMLTGITDTGAGQKLYTGLQFVNGTIAYLISLYTLGYMKRVRSAKKVVAALQAKLDKLKALL